VSDFRANFGLFETNLLYFLASRRQKNYIHITQHSSTMSLSKPQLSQPRVVATSVYDFEKYTMMYYLKGALAGGLCCGVTHGALCPVDVVKTRMQLSPEIYNKGMVDGFKKVIANEGAGALLTGLGATAVGYFIQGQFFILRVVLFSFFK
jgi:hypothetical protein